MKPVICLVVAVAGLIALAACTSQQFIPPTVTPVATLPAVTPSAEPTLISRSTTATPPSGTLSPTAATEPTRNPAADLPAVSAFPDPVLFETPPWPTPEPPPVPPGPFPTPALQPPAVLNLNPYGGGGSGTGLSVLSTAPGGEFSDPDAVRVSWYVYNDGPQTTNIHFLVYVLFDGVVVGDWHVNGLATNRYVYVEGYTGLLEGMRIDPGPHTVKLVVDPLNAVNETNESDNTAEVDIMWTGPETGAPPGEALPDLALSIPPGKHDPLFVSSWPDDYYSGKLSVDAPSHVEFNIVNESVLYIDHRVEAGLYLDGVLVRDVTWDGILAGGVNSFTLDDLRDEVAITPGPHMLRVIVDPAGRIQESDETNNSFELQLVWGTGAPPLADDIPLPTPPAREPLHLPNLSPVRPFGWDAAVTARPVNNALGEGMDGWLTTGADARIDFAFSNVSRFSIPNVPRLNATVLLDGIEVHDSTFFAGTSNQGAVWTDSVLIKKGSVTPGEHTVRVIFDPSGYFDETTESDNIVERVFTWHDQPEEKSPSQVNISEDQLRHALEPLLGEMMLQVKPVAGPGAGEKDWTPEITAAGRAGYFLVTGRDLDDEGFVTHFLPHDEFLSAAIALCMRDWVTLGETEYQRQYRECNQDRDEIGLKTRFNGQVHLFIDLGYSPAQVLGTYFHELGHGLQDLINPDQTVNRTSTYSDALLEAEAQIFEAAAWRAIEEFTGVSLTSYPDIQIVRDRLTRLLDLRMNGNDEHDIGYVLLWTEALTDTAHTGSAQALRSQGRLDAAAAKALYDVLVNLRPGQVQDWAQKLLSSVSLINEYRAIASGRLTPDLPAGMTGNPDLQDPAWLAP